MWLPSTDVQEVDATTRPAARVVDMICPFDFPRGPALRRAALARAPRLAGLRRRAKAAGRLRLYADDSFERWATDFHALVEPTRQSPGRAVVEAVEPAQDDPDVRNPRTPHSTRQRWNASCKANTWRVLVAGVAAGFCVLATALDARIRELEVAVVSDRVASSGASRHVDALSALRFGEIPMLSAARALFATPS